MYNRLHKSGGYIEKSLFKEVNEFSWGIETSFDWEDTENPNGEDQVQKYRMFVPLYNAFGRKKVSNEEYTLNKFSMRYCIIDEEENEAKFTQLKLEVGMNIKYLPDDVQRQEVIFQFEGESIKNISRIRREESNLVDLIIKVSYLPDVIECTKFRDVETKRVKGQTIKTMNPLWTNNAVENCINNQLVFRITGIMDSLFENDFNKEFECIINRNEQKYIKFPEIFEKLSSFNCLKAIDETSKLLENLPFRIHYTFLCLFSTKIIQLLDYSFDEIKNLILCIKKICSDEPMHEISVDKTLALMKPKRFNNAKSLIDQFLSEFELMKVCKEAKKHNKDMISVRRVIVTQSCILFKLPSKNMPNRVITKYKDFQNDFLRVSFRCGDSMTIKRSLPLLTHVKNIMNDGFTIGNKIFKFLHYSNSQMKAHSCWFFNETKHLNYQSIMDSLGEFEDTKVSKNAARKGQAFSSAFNVATLNLENDIERAEDFKTDNGKYIFSDGCGEIDRKLAIDIARNHYGVIKCSAFQIRMGGFKGVLLSSGSLRDNECIY